MRQPPDSAPQGRCWAASSKPRPARIWAARAGAACASMSPSRAGSQRCGVLLGVLGLRQQACALGVGTEHPVDEAVGSARRLLGDVTDTGRARHGDGAIVGRQLARDDFQQRRLAGTVAAHSPTLWPVGMPAVAASKMGRPSMR